MNCVIATRFLRKFARAICGAVALAATGDGGTAIPLAGSGHALSPATRVNSVAPGTILFPDEESDATIRTIIRTTPLRKAGAAEDIAEMVLFLATHSEFITGQVFAVDGGKSIP